MAVCTDGSRGCGSHADDDSIIGGRGKAKETISLSLGAGRDFQAGPNGGKRRPWAFVQGSAGDVSTMEGLVQDRYKHRAPKEQPDHGQSVFL